MTFTTITINVFKYLLGQSKDTGVGKIPKIFIFFPLISVFSGCILMGENIA